MLETLYSRDLGRALLAANELCAIDCLLDTPPMQEIGRSPHLANAILMMHCYGQAIHPMMPKSHPLLFVKDASRRVTEKSEVWAYHSIF